MNPVRSAALLLLFAPHLAAAQDAHWSYEGDTGPEAWADLDPANELCATGTEQSPIDLPAAVPGDVPDLERDWAADTGWTVVNNGHTIQANPADGGPAGRIIIDGTGYDLVQFHFHHPSEHALNGERTAMEAHFVHRSAEGALAVVGVLLTGGGEEGPLDAVAAAAPAEEGEAAAGVLDPSWFVPAEGSFYRYEGSLTTPPCSESVIWTVMAEPVAVSDSAVAAFAALFPNDARPLQPLNDREVMTH